MYEAAAPHPELYQACYGRVTVPESVFHRLNDNTHSLLLAEV